MGEVVRHVRRTAGLRSMSELAERSGLSMAVLQNVESGRKKDLSREQILAICRATGCSLYEFFPELTREPEYADALRQRLERIAALAVT